MQNIRHTWNVSVTTCPIKSFIDILEIIYKPKWVRSINFKTHNVYRICIYDNTLYCVFTKCVVIIFIKYNQQDASFHNLFISVRHSTCFTQFFRPSSGAQNCTYSFRYWSDKYLTLYVQFWVPDDGRKNRLKHVECLTEINKLWNVASCWLYSANILAMHGHINVK